MGVNSGDSMERLLLPRPGCGAGSGAASLPAPKQHCKGSAW